MNIVEIISSEDKKAHKILQVTKDNYIIETGVFDDGDTCHLCISSQIGCPISCQMCYNGINKNYIRNLDKKEIITQITNIVNKYDLFNNYDKVCFSFMGVGEPLLNYENVISTIKYLNDIYEKSLFALATTLPKVSDIYKITQDFNQIRNFKLTISLHAPNDFKRKKIIPSHTSMKNLRFAMEYYKLHSIHKGEFNYVLLNNFNDSDEDFKELLEFLSVDDRLKISTYNQIENGIFERATNERYEKLHNLLNNNNIYNSKFSSVGDTIEVGCGQMAAKKLERKKKNV